MSRLIAENQKNAFSIIAKKLRDDNIPVRTKKQLQQYVGAETFKEALDVMVEGYNNDIIQKREKVKRDKKNAKLKIIEKLVDIKDLDEADFMDKIMADAKKLIGKGEVYLQITQDGKIVKSEMITITKRTPESIFWNDLKEYVYEYVNGIMTFKLTGTYRFVILEQDKIPSRKIKQSLRDGKHHCVIEPLYQLWLSMSENSESEASKKRCLQVAKKIKKLEEVYKDGVPEDEMETVAKIAHRSIIIHDIIGNEIMNFNKKSTKMVHFTNTRKDHIDKGFITFDKKYEKVSAEELMNIIKESEWCLIGGRYQTPSNVRTSKGAFAVFNEKHDLYQEFNKSLGIRNYGINAVKNKQLNEFLKESRLINSAPVPLTQNPNDIDEVKHIDIEKAYTQHSKCKYYQGFLGKIHHFVKGNFKRDFIKNHIGIYQFKVIENTNKLLTQLGIIKGNIYTLPSVEILYFIDNGVKVNVFCGAFGSSFDIEYTPEMLADRNYCMWAGKLGMDSEFETYTFKGDTVWASHLKATLGDDKVYFFSDVGYIVLKVQKKSYYTTHHILSFITSYTRLNMLEIMSKIQGELVKVILDGIYYKGHLPSVDIPYKEKELIRHIGFSDAWYFQSELDLNLPLFNEKFDGNAVLCGAGGSGKTTDVFNYQGFSDILYVVPTHELGKGKRYTTIHTLIGQECRSYKELYRTPSVLLIDELTMIEDTWIEKAIKMYPECLILIAGDIDKKQWFQCRNGHTGNFSKIWTGEGWRFVNYENDYRSLDNDIKKLKVDVREEMKRIFTGKDTDTMRMKQYIQKRVQVIQFEDAIKQHQDGDIWIVGTHKTRAILKENNISCEWNGKIDNGFTVHSFQGQTIEDRKVFIRLDMFEYAMLYTAISRVRNISQLVFCN